MGLLSNYYTYISFSPNNSVKWDGDYDSSIPKYEENKLKFLKLNKFFIEIVTKIILKCQFSGITKH